MKFICLGYVEPGHFDMSESERNTTLDECFSYNHELRKNGHLAADEPLQSANKTVRTRKRRSNWVEFRCLKREI